LLDLDHGGDGLGTDRAWAEDALLAQLDHPAAGAAVAAHQRSLALGAVNRTDDDPIAVLEGAPAAEHDQRTGAAIPVLRPADPALRARARLQVLAAGAEEALGLDLVGPRVLLRLPGQPLALVVGEGQPRLDQGQLGRLVEGQQAPRDPVVLG